MRLAFVSISGYPWGGSEVLWTATAKEALRQGHEVLVSVFDRPEQHASIKQLAQLGAQFEYRRRFFPAPPARLRKKIINALPWTDRKVTYHDYLLAFKPDCIFFSQAGGDEIARSETDLMVFIRQSRVPFLVGYHSLTDRPDIPDRLRQNYRTVMEAARWNLFTSRMQCQRLEHQIARKIPNARIICHPLNTGTVPVPPFPSSDVAGFAVIGSLMCRWKGQDILLKILGSEAWKDRAFQLNIYGTGEDRDYLEQLASMYGVAGKVVFHGHENDLSRIWARNHVLLAPSRQDSGPIVCFEAMYFARPVVGSFMGAMPEYILDGETGVLACAVGEESFALAMEKLWSNRDSWKTWGEKGKALLAAKYDFKPEETLLHLMTK